MDFTGKTPEEITTLIKEAQDHLDKIRREDYEKDAAEFFASKKGKALVQKHKDVVTAVDRLDGKTFQAAFDVSLTLEARAGKEEGAAYDPHASYLLLCDFSVKVGEVKGMSDTLNRKFRNLLAEILVDDNPFGQYDTQDDALTPFFPELKKELNRVTKDFESVQKAFAQENIPLAILDPRE